MNSVELSYRKTAAAAGSSGLEVLIALYDTLAGDLRRAAEAERSMDIERRCREANHALLVIGHLEDWISQGSGGELAQHLKAFYAALRRRILEAQVKRSPAILEEQMTQVLRIREQWQTLEFRAEASGPEILRPAHAEKSAGGPWLLQEPRQMSWSA